MAAVNGPEHYREAEKWLSTSHNHTDSGDVGDARIATHAALQAQAHATLALAAATALVNFPGTPESDTYYGRTTRQWAVVTAPSGQQ